MRAAIEYTLSVVLALLFAWMLIVLVGCELDSTADKLGGPVRPPGQCGCYASLVLTDDGAVCERPAALCPRVCTCTVVSAPLCDTAGPYVCLGVEGEGDAG